MGMKKKRCIYWMITFLCVGFFLPAKVKADMGPKASVHIQFEKSSVHRHYHNERQDRDKQSADKSNRPQWDTFKKSAAFNGCYHFSR